MVHAFVKDRRNCGLAKFFVDQIKDSMCLESNGAKFCSLNLIDGESVGKL